MESRSKSRAKRAPKSPLRTSRTRADPCSSKTQDSFKQDSPVTAPPAESDLEPKRFKFQSQETNISRRTLRHKLQREKNPSPRSASPKTRARSGSVRSQKNNAPTSTAKRNRAIPSQNTVASSERPDSVDIVAAAGSTRPRREVSIMVDPSHLLEKRSEKVKPEAARLRASHEKERGVTKRSINREFDHTPNNVPGTSSLARLHHNETQLERAVKGELSISENGPTVEDVQDQIEMNRNSSVSYVEPFGQRLQFSEEASQFSIGDLENFSALEFINSLGGLFGSLRTQSLVAALIRVIKGSFGTLDDDTFLSLSSAGILDEFNDCLILACRCLCNLLEASPTSIEIIKASEAVKTIMPHLRYLRCIELGEQIIQLLLLISKASPNIVAHEQGISALVKFLDFFSIPVQRTAILAAANCCCSLELNQMSEAAEALIIISNTLGSSDAIVVENSCLLLKNLVERLRNHPTILENLFSEPFVLKILALLESESVSSTPPEPIYARLMTLVGILAKTSDALAAILLQERMLLILKQNLLVPQTSTKHKETVLSLACNLLPKICDRRQTFEAAIERTLSLKFVQVMAPAALKLCNGSASPQIKFLTLTLLLKLSLFMPTEVNRVFIDISLARFLFGLIWASSGSLYAVRALQILVVLLEKAPSIYATVLVREGIPAAIAKQCIEPQTTGNLMEANPPLLCSLEGIWAFFSHIETSVISKVNSQVGSPNGSACKRVCAVLAQAMNAKISSMAGLCPKSSSITEQLKAIFFWLCPMVDQPSIENYRASLWKLRNLLREEDVTTYELASCNFGACLDHYLGSGGLKIPQIERQKLFFDLFLADDELRACRNLVQHLNTRLEQIESYPLLLFPQDEFAVSRLLQLCQLRVTANEGLPVRPVFMTVQLMAPFSLVAQYICKVVPVLEIGPGVEFYIKDRCLDGTGTVLKALLRAGLPLDSLKANGDPISITYRRITPKPSRRETSDTDPVGEKEHDVILRVLQVVHVMANRWVTKDHWKSLPRLPPELFINERLTGKLDRQLQEAALVVSECLPVWCEHLVTNFPFLFPFATRLECFQVTALGSDRHIMNHMLAEARREGVGSFGRMAKLRMLVSRSCIIGSAAELAASRPQDRAILEIQFCDEVGSGQGPTLEYFSCVFREFCKRSLGLWREAYPSDSEFVSLQCGLYPKPRALSDPESPHERAVRRHFRTLGWITAKSLFDSRITDLPLSEAFLELLVGGAEKLERLSALRLIRSFDPTLADSLVSVSKSASDGTVDSLTLSFVLPGTQLELIANGSSTLVTEENLDAFIDATLDFLTDTGVRYAITAFKEGFNELFPLQKLAIFTPRELTAIFGNGEEDWSAEVILSAIKAEHGYTSESPAIRRFVAVASSLEKELRQNLLQFITGSRKLPIGGFCALTPNLTIVRKHCEPPLCPDDYLPSVNTCFNYLKLPDYSCEEVMRESFLTAMKEGNLSFHLS
ncbi:Ubiquitin fusion degradation protein 4 [Massospora cicadina]|nr:Ubiquitin fusion degradation protein 4 [Massospora cicadina]